MNYLILFGMLRTLTSDVSVDTWTAETLAAKPAIAAVGARLSQAELEAIEKGTPVTPYKGLTVGVKLSDGSLWVGSKQGLFYRQPADARWRLFHSRRWLPNDHVVDLTVTAEGNVYVQTPAGVGRLHRKKRSLQQRMDAVNAMIRKHHVREGLIGEINLNQPGRLDAGYYQPDSDNDGLWTSLYVAAEAFRFGATGDPKARENAWQSLQALMFLEKVTGIKGFAARSILPGTLPQPRHGEWHRSADGRLWWKGDTSSDELDGHYFAYGVYFDVAATPEQKEQIKGLIGRMTDHILDRGYYYVGPSGKPTRWGVWAPEKLNRELDWVGDRGLNSLEILSHLKVAHHITGNARYADAARDLIEKHGYALNTIWQKHIWPPVTNHSDDELAFVAYYPLLQYEHDPKLRRIYLAGLERSWLIERPERSPFLNFIYAASRQASAWKDPSKRPDQRYISPEQFDQQLCLEWFRDVPDDLLHWSIKNSDRRDIGPLVTNRQRRPTSTAALSIAERPIMRWNGDPYQLDGGADGRVRDDGAFILLPYWMGVYHRLIE